ncbi:MAG: phosphoglycerate kinase [Flavobacteriales bacterium]|nr:MAG: phosphoglycerate kinase [Flavobacteriales bacterium]
MISIDNFNFNSKRALVRVDFNVPLDKETQTITDDKRIRAALPTIQKILSDNGSAILMSHLGRPKNGPEDKFSLKHIIHRIKDITGAKIHFAKDCIGREAKELSEKIEPGEILLLENVRFYPEETQGDESFAKQLALLGDCYVNDAFGTAHRAHASTSQIAQFFPNNRMCGFLMQKEIQSAKAVMEDTKRPFTAIVGGAKVSDKVLIVKNLIQKADHIIIGGGMAYTFKKALGGQIGKSLCEDDRLKTCLDILKRAKEKGVEIHLPKDSVIANDFNNNANINTSQSNNIEDNWMGLDIGPEASKDFCEVILKSKTILWNGPMGVFEMSSFEQGTKSIAEAVATATSNGAYSLIGGGDSAAAAKKFGVEKAISHVSTGGGALLEYFEGKELPGIRAIEA